MPWSSLLLGWSWPSTTSRLPQAMLMAICRRRGTTAMHHASSLFGHDGWAMGELFDCNRLNWYWLGWPCHALPATNQERAAREYGTTVAPRSTHDQPMAHPQQPMTTPWTYATNSKPPIHDQHGPGQPMANPSPGHDQRISNYSEGGTSHEHLCLVQ